MEVILTSLALLLLKGVPLLVSYINNNSFPPPLSQEDEARYFQILQRVHINSDLDGIDEIIEVEHARNMLIEHNMRLVAFIVKQFVKNQEENEDLFSIGMIGLIKAIDSFNPNIGAKLSTYATRCIKNEILMYFRKDRSNLETSLFKPIGPDDSGDELSLIDRLSADNKPILDQVVNNEDQRDLLENVKKLPILHRQVLKMRFGLMNSTEYSQQTVSETLGISRSYVSRLEKKARQMLIKLMKERKP
ncbi:RNA polymerase sporulation sigma factor SigK [Desulfosporosinus youngiae]|uniref:RNA polymerase sigma factor, sigma-70 family n=1 Tax=Desulfosporosinus youngiae DSM 17734 TaxID=768710 RepID=H5Y418_9FIRM|nr:RNA polymerase sporulation sigma factor SigK [Desulfosporosinus youngiae]EHQ89556.1 RNA polymerase sigma factor, sigma-70 family [Desulfosporosinus youngiae DSM 17734]